MPSCPLSELQAMDCRLKPASYVFSTRRRNSRAERMTIEERGRKEVESSGHRSVGLGQRRWAMDFFDAVKARYSYRGRYKGQPVPDAHLRKIVQAGLDAPSGCNLQTTEFVIVTDPEKIQQLAGIVGRQNISSAPAIIVAVCDTEANVEGMRFWVEDCAAATENVLLAI